jgi:AraC family transcriptional regulator of adaptative response / DNA-3-methyladenine glycosylase II
MRLNAEWCYAVIKSRDRRFDGKFFTGVKTTGIYCRPICPAVTPRAENVAFFNSAAAAEGAGFRPCLRCRPESAPGTPEWSGNSALVSRALGHLSNGLLDEHGVDELARRLNVGARHLRRLFAEEIGASPQAVARSRRVAFAKKLIEETSLPMSEIAFSAGFSSIRRFNDAFRHAYRRTPTELRRGGGAAVGTAGVERNGRLSLKLYYRPPYDWLSMMQFLSARAVPGLESVAGGTYRRSFALGDVAGQLEARPDEFEHRVILTVPLEGARFLMAIAERVRNIFDLNSDPAAIARHLGRDALLSGILAEHEGLRVPGTWDGFEMVVRAIVGQQVTVKGARTLVGRLVRSFGRPMPEKVGANDGFVFPQPEALADAELERTGIIRSRANAIRSLARCVCEGTLSLETAPSLESGIATLMALPGVGRWTAEYIAMRALREPDAFPVGDLGLRRSMEKIEGLHLSEQEFEMRAENWRPWRAYAAIALWRVDTGR